MIRVALIALLIAILIPSTKWDGDNATVPTQQKLLTIGDSLTNGLYATYEDATFASLLSESLNAQLARRYVPMLPKAVEEWQKVKAWKPNIIVLEVGLNDVSAGTLPDDQWIAMYDALLLDMQSTGAKVIACTMFWAGIQPTHPNYERYLRYNQMIKEVAERRGVTIADLWARTRDCHECLSSPDTVSYFGSGYKGDNFHPGDYGHAVIAEAIMDANKQRLYIPIVIK